LKESHRHLHLLNRRTLQARIGWECDQMIDACERAGVTLTICHDRRYHEEWEALKEIVDSGLLGEIFFWKLDHNQDVIFPEGTWVRSRSGIGGGAIMSCLTHQIDGLRWYAGEVKEVSCMTRVTPERMEGESLGVVLASLENGALAELSINWRTRSNAGSNCLWYEMVQACGTQGEAYRMSERGTYVKLNENASPAAIQRFGEEALQDFVPVRTGATSQGGHKRCHAEWIRMLRQEPADIRTSGRDCRGTVEVAEAAYQSVEEERTIALPITPQPWPEEEFAACSAASTAAANYHVGG
jgi:predicted dehydrogenase